MFPPASAPYTFSLCFPAHFHFFWYRDHISHPHSTLNAPAGQTACDFSLIILRDWQAVNTSFSFRFCSLQKRAKKIEGETLYTRHSNLMLEVCIWRLSPYLLSLACLISWRFRSHISLHWVMHSTQFFSRCVFFPIFCSLAQNTLHAQFISVILKQVSISFLIVSLTFQCWI